MLFNSVNGRIDNAHGFPNQAISAIILTRRVSTVFDGGRSVFRDYFQNQLNIQLVKTMSQILLIGNAVSTLFMTGLIWFVQIVHYPLMACVESGSSCYARYQERHMRQTTWVVLPPMVVELVTSVGLLFWPPSQSHYGMVAGGAILVLLIWVSTFLLQVPAHQRLLMGFSDVAHSRLVNTNWVRTILWSLRAVNIIWMVMCNMNV